MKKCVFGCDEPAVARVQDDVVDVAVCERHKLEIQTDMYGEIITVDLDPEPETAYETLEKFPEGATHDYTVREASLGHRYGTPWPISGDAKWDSRRLGRGEQLSSVAQGTGFYVPLYYANRFALRSGKNWVCKTQETV